MSSDKTKDYVDLTDSSCDLSDLKLLLDGFEYKLKTADGIEKKGFLISKSPKGNSFTICDLHIRYSSSASKYVTTLEFRRTNQNLQDTKVRKDTEYQRIPFDSSQNGYTEFWRMVAFLTQFNEIIDIGDIKREFRVVDDPNLQKILDDLNINQLESLTAAHKKKHYESELNNLEALLELEEQARIVETVNASHTLSKYKAGQPEKILQNWIELNLWVFGVEYNKKHDSSKIAITSDSDLLMESLDGYLDLIELKRPKCEPGLFKHDASHDSYYPSPKLSSVIGQSLYYLQQMSDYKLNLEKEYKAKIIRPRVKIIIGRSKDFQQKEFDALRSLNTNMQSIQIITYDYLVSSAKKILANFD